MSRDVPTRFWKGVSNEHPRHPLGSMKTPNPTKVHLFSEDFDNFTAAQWATGGAGTPTFAATAGDGGLLALTTTGVNNDSAFIQKTPGAFTMVAGSQLWMRALLSYTDVTTPSLFVGLVNAGATIFAPTDGFWITKAAGATALSANYSAASSLTTVAFPTTLPAIYPEAWGNTSATAPFYPISNSTQFAIGFHWDGVSTLRYFFNDLAIGAYSIGTSGNPALTTATLAPAVGLVNGGAAAKVLLVDNIVCAKERF